MGWFTKLRDAVESAAVVAGNYYLPGSSMVTSKLVSEGSQKQLNSDQLNNDQSLKGDQPKGCQPSKGGQPLGYDSCLHHEIYKWSTIGL